MNLYIDRYGKIKVTREQFEDLVEESLYDRVFCRINGIDYNQPMHEDIEKARAKLLEIYEVKD